MKRSHVVAVLVAAALGLGMWAAATAQEFARNRGVITNSYVRPTVPSTARPTTQPNGAGDFNGKLVALSVRGGSQPRLLEKARFEDIHGRRFLVGQEAKATFSFPLGTPAHIAWDAVDAFYVFDSVAQYEQAMRQALEQAQGTVSEALGSFLPGARFTINGDRAFYPPPTVPGERPIRSYSTDGGEPTEASSSDQSQSSPAPVSQEEPAPKRIYSTLVPERR